MFKRTLSAVLLLIALISVISFSAMATTTDSDFSDNALAEYIIYEGVPKQVTVAGDGTNAVCIFLPEYSDTYTFTSDSTGDTVCELYLYRETGLQQLATDDDSGVDRNFSISYYLEVGNVYMLATRFYSSSYYGTYNVTVTNGHDHNYVTEDCAQGSTCTVCGHKSGDGQDHTYDDNCDTDCNVCSQTREAPHNWQGGDCTTPPTCGDCSITGTASGHTYTNACDDSCNTCGTNRTAPHDYKSVTVKATPTANGYTAKRCNLCEKEINRVTIYKASKITLSATSYTYNGKAQKPKVTVKDSSGKTISSSNYTVTYSSGCTNAGKYTVKVTFKGSKYTSSKTLSYTINKLSYTKVKISLSKTAFTYNGKTQKPSITVKDSSGKTISSSNYTVTYPSSTKKAGSYKVKVTFKGNYTGSKTLSYKINKLSYSKVTVSLSKTKFAYNGKVQTPTLKLKDSYGNTLKNKTDYTISYRTGRKNVGTQSIKITYKGNYSGSKTVTYTIAPTIKTELKGYIGDTIKIGAKSNTKITYSSSNKKIATVSSKGVITALKAGSVTITVKSGSASQKITLKVSTPTIKLKANSSMYIGTSQKITATTTPKGKVTWSVNNKKIAKISSSGKLTALKDGTVTVTAKFAYKGKTYTKTCKVKITVEYPDISVFISSKSAYSDSYAMIIDNNSSRPIKVLNRGYVYCYGDSADVDSLFASSGGSYGYFKSLGISPGSSRSFVMCLDEKMLLLQTKTTYAYIYIEYGGETFRLSCNTGRYGLNKCSTITWMRKS